MRDSPSSDRVGRLGWSSLTRGEKATEFSVGGVPGTGARDAAGASRRPTTPPPPPVVVPEDYTALLPPPSSPPPNEKSARRRERESYIASRVRARSLTRTKRGRPGGAACTTHTRTRIAVLLI